MPSAPNVISSSSSFFQPKPASFLDFFPAQNFNFKMNLKLICVVTLMVSCTYAVPLHDEALKDATSTTTTAKPGLPDALTNLLKNKAALEAKPAENGTNKEEVSKITRRDAEPAKALTGSSDEKRPLNGTTPAPHKNETGKPEEAPKKTRRDAEPAKAEDKKPLNGTAPAPAKNETSKVDNKSSTKKERGTEDGSIEEDEVSTEELVKQGEHARNLRLRRNTYGSSDNLIREVPVAVVRSSYQAPAVRSSYLAPAVRSSYGNLRRRRSTYGSSQVVIREAPVAVVRSSYEAPATVVRSSSYEAPATVVRSSSYETPATVVSSSSYEAPAVRTVVRSSSYSAPAVRSVVLEDNSYGSAVRQIGSVVRSSGYQ